MEREALLVEDGYEYDHLFPRAAMGRILIKENAKVEDTVKLIQKIVRETVWQAKKFAAFIKGKSLEDTCRRLWTFCYTKIAYKKDEKNKEQVRDFCRVWADRHNFKRDKNRKEILDENGNKIPNGCDCDCVTSFISTTLSALRIKHALRRTKYWEDHFQHIYVVVPIPGGGYYTLDPVVHQFNYEEPFSENKDTIMDLEYLNGVPDSNRSIDAIEMAGINDDLGELGKLFKKASGGGAPKKGIIKKVFQKGGVKQIVQNTKQNVKTTVQAVKKGGIKEAVKVFQNITNKGNPGTIPIRMGIIAAMETNFFKIAQRLKYAYLTDGEAQNRGVDMGKLKRLREVRDRLENAFYNLGGNRANFKQAILTGRGNRNKDVLAGLGYAPRNLQAMSFEQPISQLLGDMCPDENFNSVEGLGEVATAAVITAATGLLGAIALVLKQVGTIFPKKTNGSADFENVDNEGTSAATPDPSTDATTQNTDAQATALPGVDPAVTDVLNDKNVNSPQFTPASDTIRTVTNSNGGNVTSTANSNTSSSVSQSNSSEQSNTDASQTDNAQNNLPTTQDNQTPASDTNSDSNAKKEPGFWDKNKKWIIPSSAGTVILLVSFLSYKMLNKPDADKLKLAPTLHGIPEKKKKKGKKKGGNKPKITSKKKKKTVASF